MPRRRPPAQASQSSTAPPAAADPDTALIHVRHAEAVVRAAERQDAHVRATAAAMVTASAAKVESTHADLQAARTAALAAARAAQREGRALAPATHPTALPADILLYVASFLPQRDLLRMVGTCTSWRDVLLASPSPIFRSVRVDFKDLLSGSIELPLLAKLKVRAPDIMALHFSGPKTKRDHAWVASLLASCTRLTSLTYETRSPRGDWIGLPLAAAATSCPGLVLVRVLSMTESAPSPADIFRSLGAALARLTRISFYTYQDAVLDAGREQRGTPWLEPATALRELKWDASALPVLPATLKLRTLDVGYPVRSVPPAALTPGLRSVRYVSMFLHEDATVEAILRGATRVTRLEALSTGNGKPMSPLVAHLSALRELSWGLSTSSITPAASLNALTAMWLYLWNDPAAVSVAPGTVNAFTALRTLHVATGPGVLLSMPALGPDFAPHLNTLSVDRAKLDLATVATTWEAASLRELTLTNVKLTVDASNVPENDGAIGAALAAAVSAAAAWDRAHRDLQEMDLRVDELLELAEDEDDDGFPVFATEEELAAYHDALEAANEAADAVPPARAAKDAADRRLAELVNPLVVPSLPAALPALTRVVFDGVHTEPSATAAADALRALNGRAARGGRRAGG